MSDTSASPIGPISAGVIEHVGPTTGPDGSVTATFGTEGGDAGMPTAISRPDSPAGVAFLALAQVIVEDVAPPQAAPSTGPTGF